MTNKVLLLLSLFAVLSMTVAGAPLLINSTPGLDATLLVDNTAIGAGYTAGSTHSTVAITAHPAWQANNPLGSNAVWISYARTGYSNPDFQPFMGTTPVMELNYNFSSAAGMLNLSVWSDDTADVLLDGGSLMAAVFTQSTCSGQPIGCRPEDAGVISKAIGAGPHVLTFRSYQVGTGGDTTSNPFGLMFSGTAPAVPEPATLGMMGAGLIALAVFGRRRFC